MANVLKSRSRCKVCSVQAARMWQIRSVRIFIFDSLWQRRKMIRRMYEYLYYVYVYVFVCKFYKHMPSCKWNYILYFACVCIDLYEYILYARSGSQTAHHNVWSLIFFRSWVWSRPSSFCWMDWAPEDVVLSAIRVGFFCAQAVSWTKPDRHPFTVSNLITFPLQ